MADQKSSPVSVRVKDYLGNTAVATGYADFADGDTYGTSHTALQAFLTDLDHVTGAIIEECTYKNTVPLPGGLKSTATIGAPNSTTLSINFTNSQDKDAYAFTLPALDPACILAGGPDVTSGASIDTLQALMIAGLTGTTGGHFTTNADGPLLAAYNARIATRSHRKQLQQKSSRAIA